MDISLGLSYDDVLLVPKLTPLRSRSRADTAGWVTPALKLPAPFLSANMDTVTGFKMAAALARLGAIGVIHQFQSPQKEAAEVARVKSAKPGNLPVAAAVMGGNIFAGCDETPGKIVLRKGKKYKQYRGSSTLAATNSRLRRGGGSGKNLADQWSRIEGVEALIPCRGPVEKVLKRYLGGLRSGLSYCGAKNLGQLQANAQFIRITAAGWKESLPHDVVI